MASDKLQARQSFFRCCEGDNYDILGFAAV
jgi:hypothetical protein